MVGRMGAKSVGRESQAAPNGVELATDLILIEMDSENFFRRMVTGDEVWTDTYDPETKQQSKG